MKRRLPDITSVVSPPLLWVAAAVFVVTIFLPKDGVGSSQCGFQIISGKPCLGCGMTRGVTGLTHLDPVHAWEMHPFAFITWPLMIVLAAAAVVRPFRRWLTEGFLPRHRLVINRLFWITAVLFLVFGVSRIAFDERWYL